jgi:hypothetical protein
MNTRTSLIAVTSLTATFVALCAAIFSITGIAKLFAGAFISVGIMASALELGKIVSISFLYQYWREIPRLLKVYLTTAAIVLMVITSAGIYGYLTAAYAKVSAVPTQISADIQSIQQRVETVNQDIDRKNQRLDQLITLRSQQENRLDDLIGKSQSGNTTTIRTAQSGLAQADRNVAQLQTEIQQLSQSRDSLTGISIQKSVEIETNGDIGTFLYIAKIFEVPLDTVVKWFTLILVLVFDPLAVALIIAVNFLLKNKHQESEIPAVPTPIYEVYPDTPIHEPSIDVPLVEQDAAKCMSDRQYFARGDFDWSNESVWKDNPVAVKYYNDNIKPRISRT